MLKRIFLAMLIHLFVMLLPVYGAGVIQDGLYLTYKNGGPLLYLELYRRMTRDGAVFEYFEDGEVKKLFHYKDGTIDGVARIFYADGKLQKMILFKDGEIVLCREFDTEGNRIND